MKEVTERIRRNLEIEMKNSECLKWIATHVLSIEEINPPFAAPTRHHISWTDEKGRHRETIGPVRETSIEMLKGAVIVAMTEKYNRANIQAIIDGDRSA